VFSYSNKQRIDVPSNILGGVLLDHFPQSRLVIHTAISDLTGSSRLQEALNAFEVVLRMNISADLNFVEHTTYDDPRERSPDDNLDVCAQIRIIHSFRPLREGHDRADVQCRCFGNEVMNVF